MQEDSRVPPEGSSPAHHPFWETLAAVTAGGWIGLLISVAGWFKEPLEAWFEVAKVTTAAGACGGLVFAAGVALVRKYHRRALPGSGSGSPAPTPAGSLSEEGATAGWVGR